MVEAKPVIKSDTINKRRAKENHGYHMPRHKEVKIHVFLTHFILHRTKTEGKLVQFEMNSST